LSEQAPFTHEPVQHSFGATQATPGALHCVSDGAHVLEAVSQFAVQQSALVVQLWPTTLQIAASLSDASELEPSLSLPSCDAPSAEPSPLGDGPISSLSLPQPAKTLTVASAVSTASAAQGSFLIPSS
jgi:hypothetical protein